MRALSNQKPALKTVFTSKTSKTKMTAANQLSSMPIKQYITTSLPTLTTTLKIFTTTLPVQITIQTPILH